MRSKLVLLSALLATAPLTARAQFQDQYTHVAGGNVSMGAPMRSRVSLQTPAGDVLYLSADGGAFDFQGFRLHKVSSTGSWITTYTDPGGADPNIAPLAMTLAFDGLHVIIVGLEDEDFADPILAVLKVRISDGAVIWSKRVESTGGFDLVGPWDGAVIAPHPGSQTFLIFGNEILVTPSGVRRKLAGFAINPNGNLAWSRLYLEAGAQRVERLNNRPTDIAIDGNLAFVATELDDNNTNSRIGLFRINATTGEFVNMRLYSDPDNRKLFNPRIDVVAGGNRRIAMTFDEFDGPPWVALTANNGNVLWSQRITSATTSGGIFRNSLLPSRLDTFVGEADKAGIVSFGLGAGAILDEHYMALLSGDEDIVSMDRSQNESYILSLEQRDAIDLVATGMGYIFADDATDAVNTFTLVLTDTPANPLACEIDRTTTVAAHALNKRNLDYVNDDWARLENFDSSTIVNTTMSATACP